MPAWTNQTWAGEALKRAIGKLREAGPGTRNETLFLVAADLANYVADGSLDHAYVESVMLAEAGQVGLTPKEAKATLHSALQRGDSSKAWYPSTSPGSSIPGQERRVTWGGRVLVLRTGKPALADETLADIDAPIADACPNLRVTWYPTLREVQGEASEWTWQELALAVTEPMDWPGEKSAIPLWSLAEIEGDNRGRRPAGLDAGGREKDRDPETYKVHGLVLDYDDDERWSLEQVREWWGDVQYVAHSSASHDIEKEGKPAHGRGRVIVALSRAVNVQEYARLAEWVLHSGRGVVGASELKATRRAYYVPTRAPGGYVGAANLSGKALDVDALLAMLEDAEKGALEDVAADEPDPTTWATLEVTPRNGELVARDHLLNVTRVLDADPRWAGRLRWSDFIGAPELDGHTLTDEEEGHAAVWLGQVYGIHPPMTRVHEAIRIVCHRHRYHPVRKYLDGLVWDGVERLDVWLATWAGCEVTDDELSAVYGRKWAISAVARVYEPGCKADNVLVLQGGQGIGKSRILRAMAGAPFYSDSALAIGERDGYQSLRGVWIFELGELDSVRRSDWSAVKAFLSAQVDRFRPSYGRNTIEVPRQVVFAGSTNEGTFLGDSTGSRRFWVRKVVEPTSVGGLGEARDQLWAEAVHRYKAGERWWLSDEEEAARRTDSEQYQIDDPWSELIRKWLNAKSTSSTTVTEILRGAIGKSMDSITKGDEMRISALLSTEGWFKGRTMVDGTRVTRWSKA
jgi:virulence-associated protein E